MNLAFGLILHVRRIPFKLAKNLKVEMCMIEGQDNRNLGEQPIARIMVEQGISRGDLVAKSDHHITYKMVARACKGRRLTAHSKQLILAALNEASSVPYAMSDVFNY